MRKLADELPAFQCGARASFKRKRKAACAAELIKVSLYVIPTSALAHTNHMQYEKVYVGMLLHVDTDGNMKPVVLEWVDGSRYPISRVIDKRSAPPAHVGSAPTIRYTVLIQGRERVVYYEKFSNRWFVEKQV